MPELLQRKLRNDDFLLVFHCAINSCRRLRHHFLFFFSLLFEAAPSSIQAHTIRRQLWFRFAEVNVCAIQPTKNENTNIKQIERTEKGECFAFSSTSGQEINFFLISELKIDTVYTFRERVCTFFFFQNVFRYATSSLFTLAALRTHTHARIFIGCYTRMTSMFLLFSSTSLFSHWFSVWVYTQLRAIYVSPNYFIFFFSSHYDNTARSSEVTASKSELSSPDGDGARLTYTARKVWILQISWLWEIGWLQPMTAWTSAKRVMFQSP